MTQAMSSPLVCQPRATEPGRGVSWLTEGFGYFQKDALAWIGVTVLLVVILIALALIPLLGSLAGQILLPVFYGGLMLGCRAQAQGGEFRIAHLFAGFSRHNGQLMILGLLYLAGMIVIVILTAILFFSMGGNAEILAELQSKDVTALLDHFRFLMLIWLVAMALYVPLLMAYWFAPTLVVLRNVSAVDAMALSFNGCLMNVVPFLLYGAVGLVLVIIAMIPLGLGLLVLIPVITASIYVAYNDIYPES